MRGRVDRGGPGVGPLAGLLLLATLAQPAGALVTVTGSFPIPQLSLFVGTGGGTVDTVSFTVPAAEVGSGNAVVGTPSIVFSVRLRARANVPDFELSVDSSAGLGSGANSIPMTEIAWDSLDGDIPAGQFQGVAGQHLIDVSPQTRVQDTLTFRYLNTTVPPDGTYTGTVTYTFSRP